MDAFQVVTLTLGENDNVPTTKNQDSTEQTNEIDVLDMSVDIESILLLPITSTDSYIYLLTANFKSRPTFSIYQYSSIYSPPPES